MNAHPDYLAYVAEALDYIADQSRWAEKFPQQCHERIRLVCAAVKAGEPLPFKPMDDLIANLPSHPGPK